MWGQKTKRYMNSWSLSREKKVWEEDVGWPCLVVENSLVNVFVLGSSLGGKAPSKTDS